MDLRVIIQNCNLNEISNIFCVVQIDEFKLGEKNKSTTKYRTEIQFNTANPNFKKNVFNFPGLKYNSKIILKIGCFNTRFLSEPPDPKKLIDNSLLKGMNQFSFTQKIIERLRVETQISEDIVLFDSEEQNKEFGRLSVIFRHKSHDLVAQVEEDVERIQKVYYDPYEIDHDIIRQRIETIDKYLLKKQEELVDLQKKATYMRTAHKSVSFEHATLLNQRDALERENDSLRKYIEKKNDVKELHIWIELLKTTNYESLVSQDFLKIQGLLNNKFLFENQLYQELSSYFYQIEDEFKASKQLQNDLNNVKDSLKEQEFIIKRCEDQKPQVENLKETIQNQEDIIINLQNQVKETMKANSKLEMKELKYNLDKLKSDRELLKQKQKQLQGLIEIGKGEIKMDVFQRFKNDSYIADNPNLIKKFKTRADMLLKEIEMINSEVEKNAMIAQNKQQFQDLGSSEIDLIQLRLDQANNKAEILQEQMISMTKTHANQITGLKAQIQQLENEILMKQTNIA